MNNFGVYNVESDNVEIQDEESEKELKWDQQFGVTGSEEDVRKLTN